MSKLRTLTPTLSQGERESYSEVRLVERLHDLAPQGMAGFVLANGSAPAGSSNQSGDCNARSARRNWATNSQGLGSQRDTRQKLIEAELVNCMAVLPGQLIYSTSIPVCLWFIGKSEHAYAFRHVTSALALAS